MVKHQVFAKDPCKREAQNSQLTQPTKHKQDQECEQSNEEYAVLRPLTVKNNHI